VQFSTGADVTGFGAKCYKPQLLGGVNACFRAVFNRLFHRNCGWRFCNNFCTFRQKAKAGFYGTPFLAFGRRVQPQGIW